MKPAAFRARTGGRPNSRSLPFQVTGNVQGNASGKICTPLSFQNSIDQSRPGYLCNSGGGAMTDPWSEVTPPEIFNLEILSLSLARATQV